MPYRKMTEREKRVWIAKIVGILGILVLFAIVDGVVVGIQDINHHYDQTRLTALKTELASQNSSLNTLNQKISTENNTLTSMQSSMSQEQTAGETDLYNSQVDTYNNTLGAYKADVASYNFQVTTYNNEVNEGNKLAQSIGTTWYVVPIPRAAGSHVAD